MTAILPQAPPDAVQAVRSSPTLAADPQTIAELSRAADGWPAGTERTEARLLCAEAFSGRLAKPELALGPWRKVASDAAADPTARAFAADALVSADLDAADLTTAHLDATTYATLLDARALRRLHALERRHTLTSFALAEIVLTLALAAVTVGRALRVRGARRDAIAAAREVLPVAAAFATLVGLGGGLLVHAFDGGQPWPFLIVAATVLVTAPLVRAWSAIAPPRAAFVRAGLAAGLVTSAVFLALAWWDPNDLAGLGL